MTDVRLTIVAEDGQVYPVLGNTKGELKLEEPTINSDDYVAKAGDTMTGNLHLGDKIILNPDGSAQFGGGHIDFYENGSAEFAGDVQVGSYNLDSKISVRPSSLSESAVYAFEGDAGYTGSLFAAQYNQILAGSDAKLWEGIGRLNGVFDTTSAIYPDGSAEFAGEIKVANDNVRLTPSGSILAGNSPGDIRVNIQGTTGSAEFAGDVVIGSRSKQWMIVESGGIAHLVEQTRNLNAVPFMQYPELRNIPHELDLIEQALNEVMDKLRMNPPAGWPVWDGSDED